MKKEYAALELEIMKWNAQEIFCSGEITDEDDDIYWTPNY